ncbi:MAG: TIM barrel protein [Chryseolinea sp.]
MERREFLSQTLASSALLVGTPLAVGVEGAKAFNMKFSPDFGIFKAASGDNIVDQIKWGYDQGFRAWENTGLKFRSVSEQESISKTVQQLGMEFGQFVGTMTFEHVTFAGKDVSARDAVLKDIRQSVEIAKRMNTKFVHNVLGMGDPKLPYDFQMANAIELLKRIAEIYEPHNLVMVMESMNHKIDHPGMFLHTIPQAYALAKAVGSPAVKVLFDFYHVQIEEGNLLKTLDYAYDEIAYYQLADNPGRTEPTTGEINFTNALQYLHNKGYRGFMGLEHSIKKPGKDGALAALDAYRVVDPKG